VEAAHRAVGLYRAQLLRRFHGPSPAAARQPRRTVGELLAAAEARWAQRQAREREAAERKRREQAAGAARQQRLDALAGRQEQAWQQIDTMIETKRPKEYDAAVALSADLQAVAERDDGGAAFVERIRGLRAAARPQAEPAGPLRPRRTRLTTAERGHDQPGPRRRARHPRPGLRPAALSPARQPQDREPGCYAGVKPSARYPGMRRWSEAARIGVAGSW
jgi:hypothetical protein